MAHKVIILGASGYTGAELVRLIASHPDMEITALSADRKAGLAMADVFFADRVAQGLGNIHGAGCKKQVFIQNRSSSDSIVTIVTKLARP